MSIKRLIQSKTQYYRTAGFSLIELLSVVSIIGIILAVAVPSYRTSVLKSGRTEGKAKLMEIAAQEEQFFLDNKTYSTDVTGNTALNLSADSETGRYTISAAACAGGSIAICYILTATRNASQQDDTECGNLTLTSSSLKGATGSDPSNCW